jgi:hypothetical protein
MEVLEWTADEVATWLHRLGLPESVTGAFQAKQVDGPTLLELGEEDVRTALGVEDAIQRKKIKGHVEALKLRAAAQAAATPVSSHSTPLRGGMNGTPGLSRLPPRGVDGELPTPIQPDGYPTPREDQYLRRTPHSARSSERLDQGWADSGGGSRYSHLLSRYPTVSNVDTSFGWDSPSFSIKGSFSRATRKTERSWTSGTQGPGPTSYHTSEQRTRSPRAIIGQSSRDTAEHFLRGKSTPGAGQYNPGTSQNVKGSSRVKGGVIPAAPRFKSPLYPFQDGRSGAVTLTPGPAHYHVRHSYRSNFR